MLPTVFRCQGNVDKVVVVIKDHNDIALERFIFSIKHMIQLESYDRDERYNIHVPQFISKLTATVWYRIVGAISGSALSQYFRSFLVKLSMMESQLGLLIHDGMSRARLLHSAPFELYLYLRRVLCDRPGAPGRQSTASITKQGMF